MHPPSRACLLLCRLAGARNWGDEVDAQLEGALDAQKEKETAAIEEWKYYYV